MSSSPATPLLVKRNGGGDSDSDMHLLPNSPGAGNHSSTTPLSISHASSPIETKKSKSEKNRSGQTDKKRDKVKSEKRSKSDKKEKKHKRNDGGAEEEVDDESVNTSLSLTPPVSARGGAGSESTPAPTAATAPIPSPPLPSVEDRQRLYELQRRDQMLETQNNILAAKLHREVVERKRVKGLIDGLLRATTQRQKDLEFNFEKLTETRRANTNNIDSSNEDSFNNNNNSGTNIHIPAINFNSNSDSEMGAHVARIKGQIRALEMEIDHRHHARDALLGELVRREEDIWKTLPTEIHQQTSLSGGSGNGGEAQYYDKARALAITADALKRLSSKTPSTASKANNDPKFLTPFLAELEKEVGNLEAECWRHSEAARKISEGINRTIPSLEEEVQRLRRIARGCGLVWLRNPATAVSAQATQRLEMRRRAEEEVAKQELQFAASNPQLECGMVHRSASERGGSSSRGHSPSYSRASEAAQNLNNLQKQRRMDALDSGRQSVQRVTGMVIWSSSSDDDEENEYHYNGENNNVSATTTHHLRNNTGGSSSAATSKLYRGARGDGPAYEYRSNGSNYLSDSALRGNNNSTNSFASRHNTSPQKPKPIAKWPVEIANVAQYRTHRDGGCRYLLIGDYQGSLGRRQSGTSPSSNHSHQHTSFSVSGGAMSHHSHAEQMLKESGENLFQILVQDQLVAIPVCRREALLSEPPGRYTYDWLTTAGASTLQGASFALSAPGNTVSVGVANLGSISCGAAASDSQARSTTSYKPAASKWLLWDAKVPNNGTGVLPNNGQHQQLDVKNNTEDNVGPVSASSTFTLYLPPGALGAATRELRDRPSLSHAAATAGSGSTPSPSSLRSVAVELFGIPSNSIDVSQQGYTQGLSQLPLPTGCTARITVSGCSRDQVIPYFLMLICKYMNPFRSHIRVGLSESGTGITALHQQQPLSTIAAATTDSMAAAGGVDSGGVSPAVTKVVKFSEVASTMTAEAFITRYKGLLYTAPGIALEVKAEQHRRTTGQNRSPQQHHQALTITQPNSNKIEVKSTSYGIAVAPGSASSGVLSYVDAEDAVLADIAANKLRYLLMGGSYPTNY